MEATSTHGDARVLGSVAIGVSLQQVVYIEVDAKLQAEAMERGRINFPTSEEAAKPAATNDALVRRAWVLWRRRAMKRESVSLRWLAPAPLFEMPAIAASFPAMRDPFVTASLADPVALRPHVMAAVPAIIAGRPNVSRARRRHDLYPIRRRSDVDLDRDARRLPRDGDDHHADRQQRTYDASANVHGTSLKVLTRPDRFEGSLPLRKAVDIVSLRAGPGAPRSPPPILATKKRTPSYTYVGSCPTTRRRFAIQGASPPLRVRVRAWPGRVPYNDAASPIIHDHCTGDLG
jgi:hypothetical protein